MVKATLLTASKVELSVSTNPRSDIIRLLRPSLQTALRFQSLVGSVSLFVCFRAWFLANFAFAGMLYTSRIVALQVYFATKFGAFHSLSISSKAVVGVWRSKRVQRFRDKLWYEFALFVLGSGNTIFLMLFWPGWWLLAGSCWAVWALFG